IALDPQYAAAYAAQSLTQLLDWLYWNPFRFPLEQVLALAQRAVELDASLPWIHRFLALVYLWQKQYAQALAAAERALALDPKDADSHVTLAGMLSATGQPEKAVGLTLKAMALSPSSADWYRGELGFAYYLMGRYREAAAALQRALLTAPDYFSAHLDLA